MKKTIYNALNEHLKLEFDAFYKYKAMAQWCTLHDLHGFKKWLGQQSADELLHAQKFIDHLLDRDQQPILPAIAQPPSQWGSPLELVSQVLAAEQKVTTSIAALYDLAEKEGDRATLILLQWFVTEQIEEEQAAHALLGRLKLAGDSGVGLLMVDQELQRGGVPGVTATTTPEEV